MRIRQYDANDKDDVILLWTQCGLIVPHNDPAKDIDRKLKVGSDLFLVGVNGESEIVATVMGGYDGHRGWINYLAVKPSQQRKGYGRLIMQAVETLIRNRGCPKINLQVRAGNQAVIAFYTAIGYGDDHVIGLGKRLEHDV
ncbi:GNAT family acetyltransferase [Exilibacterium tricleocarpae]|uniref:GNAT family acetyltransferase n=1 Tax=Exilibacterium tricleocarpae TaxID=2591008 RepID=A0A545SXG6_9GAMM|nr:GNAT family acetyltransferase [Exilibacterium tricleocarpae]TQV69658.1 GNAT family acetyltransferase [Exilibacterium tricleocarpae]